MLTPGFLLDAAVAALGVAALEGVQLHGVEQLLARAAWPAEMPRAGGAGVRSWRETQGLGDYSPPLTPYPLLPTQPGLLYSSAAPALPALAALLARRYPPHHPLCLLTLAESGALLAKAEVALAELPGFLPEPFSIYLVYLPPLPISADRRDVAGLRWVLARLLGPGGCPWDVRQTHQSLRPALLEETYEVLEALDAGDMAGLSEELGDLLIAIVAHSEMARQGGAFDLEDLLEQVTSKLIRRHPHVFAELTVDGEGAVLHNWEQIKASELAAKGRARASALDGVPVDLPALAAAQKVGKKAARTGFNWPSLDGVWAKLEEELAELRAAAASGDLDHTAEELGDLLFVLTRLASWLDLDAETALREAVAKFRRRFSALEALLAERGLTLASLERPAMLALWREVKER